MPEPVKSQFVYVFDPVRPELVTDPDAWTEEDIHIANEHFAYLQKATTDGIVILAGRSLDGVGPAVVIFEADSEDDAGGLCRPTPLSPGA